jgi:Protein of unknown function (DUF3071)
VEAKEGDGHDIVRLKAVGVSDDGLALFLATRANARTGGFVLQLDEALLEHLEDARSKALAARDARGDPRPAAAPSPPPPPPPRPRVESRLSVKEIQAMLREGRSVQQIAKKAGVEETWIQKFQAPIVWERAGMASRARRSVVVKTRSGPSAVPLDDAVLANLRARGIVLSPSAYENSWDSIRRVKSGTWTVTFTFDARGRSHVAKWEYDTETMEVRPQNKLAGDLGWIQSRRRRASAPA